MPSNAQIDVDVVLRLKNLDKLLNEIKSKIGSIKLPDFKFSAQSAQAFSSFMRVMSQSGPQMNQAAKNINNFSTAIQGATARLNLAAPGLRAYAQAMNALNNTSRATSKATVQTTTAMEDLGRQTALTVRRFGGFLIARDLVFGLTFAFKTVIVEAIKFEREITKVAQIQNSTLESSRELGKFIGNLSIQFGTSSSELAKSAQTLAQAGKRSGEIKSILQGLSQASLLPTFGDLAKSTDSFLAVLGQFNIKASDSARVLDVLNSVSKDFNVSIDELFEGIRRSGSTFAELSGVRAGTKPGIDALKEFVALFTAVIDTSRESADTIGTAFRTIIPRLQRGKTRELLKKELGLDLLDDTNQFVGPFKAIEKLFQGLSRFKGTDPGLIRIVEEIGGSRQVNRLLPLVQEFPKAQRALEIANKSAGSVAEDTALAYQTLVVQMQQIKEQFLALGRDLVNSGTFKAYAEGFLSLAKAAASLAQSLEPLLPLLGVLGGLASLKGAASFGRGALLDNAFRIGSPVRKASGGSIDRVDALLTPGELVLSPEAAKINGDAALRRFNATGDISALRTLKGASLVPGTGNSDSVQTKLEPGSFVIRKDSVQKALGMKHFAEGGRVRLASGGQTPDFRLSSRLGGLDVNTTRSLIEFGGELRQIGNSTKKVNTLFESILKSSRDVPTALSRISREVDRARLGGYTFSSPTSLMGGGTSSGHLNIPMSAARPSTALTVIGPQSQPDPRQPASVGQYAMLRVDRRLRGRQLSEESRQRLIADEVNRAKLREINTSKPISVTGPTTNAIGDLRRALIQAPRAIEDEPTSAYSQLSPAQQRRFGQRSFIGNQFRAAGIKTQRGLHRLKQGVFGRGLTGGLSDRGLNVASSTALLSTIAGASISSSANTAGGAGFGGALSGAGIGAGIGLTTGPLAPIAVPLGALAGALIGAAGAAKSFTQELERTKTQKAVSAFLGGSGKLNDVTERFGAARAGISNTPQGFFSRLVGVTNTNTAAQSRAGFLANLGANISHTGSALTGGAIGNFNAHQSLATRQIETETADIQSQFGAVGDSFITKISEDVKDKITKGQKIGDVGQFVRRSFSKDEIALAAVSNKAFKSSDLKNPARLQALGEGVLIEAAKAQAKASESLVRLSDVMGKLTRSTIDLQTAFDNIDANLRQSEVVFSNFQNQIQAVLEPSQLTTNNRFNPFSDVKGVSTNLIRDAVNERRSEFGITGQDRTGSAAILAAEIQNNLPARLAAAAQTNQGGDLGQFLRDQFSGMNANPQVLNAVNDAINAMNFEENTTLNSINLDPNSAREIADQISAAFGGDRALKTEAKVFDLRQARREREVGIINTRSQIEGRVVDQQLGINSLRNQQLDVRRSILGQAGPTIGEAQRWVGADLAALGASSDPAQILDSINQLKQGGVTPEEQTSYNNLIKALELLRSDTRVLDATMQKNNEIQQAAQGSRGFLERLLGGPDAIAQVNQEISDLGRISRGENIGGPRALAALNTGRQLSETLTDEQVQAQFGITKQQLEQNLNNVLTSQGLARISPNSRQFAQSLASNLQPQTNLANTAANAVRTQGDAAAALQELDQQKVQDLNKLLQEQGAIFGAEIKKAFEAEPVTKLADALTAVSAGAKLEIGGQMNLIVSFNGADSVVRNIQEDLKTFVGGVVTEQIKIALQNNAGVAKSNTA